MKMMKLFGNMGTENMKYYKYLILLLVPFFALTFFAGGCPEPSLSNYTVTFNTDGGSTIPDQVVTSGGKATRPSTNPTKAGYTFVDWYKESTKTTVFNFATETIIANTTIYAKWSAIPITSVSLNQSVATLDLQATLQLTATVLPADVLDKSLTWTSSNNTIATVSSTGLVTALSSGAATITATSVADITKKATLTLTVTTYFTIPDANFRAALKSQFPNAFPAGQNDKIDVSHTDVKDFTGTIDVNRKSISNLIGIEYFTKLTSLYCYFNQLTSLDVSKNTALTTLLCDNNQLTSLDVSKNTALTSLDCYSNQLTSLDVSKNTSLTSLSCYFNQLTSLDLSKNTSLTSLSCYSNKLTSLDVSKNTALTSLDCYSNQLTSLDVSKNTALTTLWCNSNQLTSLDVSKNVALTQLLCYNNQLTNLDVSKNTALIELLCYNNQLTNLDVSKNTALTSLRCNSNELTSLDVRGMRSVGNLLITTNGSGTNNSGLTSIKVHSSITSTDPTSTLNAELIKVRAAVVVANNANYAQVDSYTSTGTPSVTYTSAVCDYDPNTGARVATDPKGCKP